MKPIFHSIPVLSANPTNWEYFWDHLAFGFPLLFSGIIGIFLVFLGLWSAYKNKDKREYFLSFSIFLFSLATFSLILFVRFTFFDKEIILELNQFLYYPFRICIVGAVYFSMMVTKKTKFMLALLFYSICNEAWGIYHLYIGDYFTGQFQENELGKFPLLSKTIQIQISIPLLAITFCFIRICIFAYQKKSQVHTSIIYGFIGFILLFLNALLIVSGKGLFPFVVFFFVPMFLLTYGVFRSDFLNLNELLFKKNLLFYIFSIFLSVVFLLLSVIIAFFFNSEHGFSYRNGYFLIPLFSFVVTVCLSAYIAGNKPEDKFVMFVALSIFMQGILALLTTVRGLYLPLFIEHRIGQIINLIFLFVSSISFRILYYGYEKPVPKLARLIDIASITFVLFALSPYLYSGYYEYTFGRASSSGLINQLFQTMNFFLLIKILFDWFKFRKDNRNPLVDWIMFCLVLAGILAISTYPSTHGIDFYPLNNLQFIPTFLYAFAIFKYKALPILGETTSLTNRISFYAIFIVPILLLFYASSLYKEMQALQMIYQLSLIGSTIFVSFFAFTFILLRPLAKKLDEENIKLAEERNKSDRLLLNILPQEIAEELKTKGYAEPTHFDSVTVLFTDFKGFTQIAESLTPNELVHELDSCFSYFDSMMSRYKLEKLKTIGDSYMCAGGIPKLNRTHAIDCVLAALEIQSIMNQMQEIKTSAGIPYWELRLGIHTGPLVAGVIGEKKFAYDVWGDTVNIASRMESSGTTGKINISGSTYQIIKDFFDCEYRGKVNAKNKGEVDMYYVNGINTEYAKDKEKRIPNEKFWIAYRRIESVHLM